MARTNLHICKNAYTAQLQIVMEASFCVGEIRFVTIDNTNFQMLTFTMYQIFQIQTPAYSKNEIIFIVSDVMLSTLI